MSFDELVVNASFSDEIDRGDTHPKIYDDDETKEKGVMMTKEQWQSHIINTVENTSMSSIRTNITTPSSAVYGSSSSASEPVLNVYARPLNIKPHNDEQQDCFVNEDGDDNVIRPLLNTPNSVSVMSKIDEEENKVSPDIYSREYGNSALKVSYDLRTNNKQLVANVVIPDKAGWEIEYEQLHWILIAFLTFITVVDRFVEYLYAI